MLRQGFSPVPEHDYLSLARTHCGDFHKIYARLLCHHHSAKAAILRAKRPCYPQYNSAEYASLFSPEIKRASCQQFTSWNKNYWFSFRELNHSSGNKHLCYNFHRDKLLKALVLSEVCGIP